MNSVGCAREECDYFVCEYCFDNLTEFSFKEQILESDGIERYLYNNRPPSSLFYHWIDSAGF